MNTARSRDRKQPNVQTFEQRAIWEQVRAATQAQRADDRKQVEIPGPLPDLWLADSSYLLQELARIRDLVNRVPLASLEISLPLHSVRDAIWRLEQQLRYLLNLHRDGQRSFAKRAAAASKSRVHTPKKPQVVQISA